MAARFALAPNSLSYCGKSGFGKKSAAYFSRPSKAGRAALEKPLRSFKAHYAYLRLIARASGKRPFGAKVPEALWIGNSLLGKVRRKDMQKLILSEFSGPGLLPREKAIRLADALPKGVLPHHSFHALYLHTITGVIRPSVKNADSCMVHWGKVLQIGKGAALVQSQRLVRKKGKLLLIPCKRRLRLSCAGISPCPHLRAGDPVASHWDFAVMALSPRQSAALEKATRRNIGALNRG